MASNDVSLRISLRDAPQAAAGARRVASGIDSITTSAHRAGAAGLAMGDAYTRGVERAGRGIGHVVRQSRYGILGLAGLGAAGTKWGLSFNAQVEAAQQRFRLFTDDVDGLTSAVQGIDRTSQFNFGDLADAAAMLGNQGVKDVPTVLQGIANAAAASGGGADSLMSISRAMGQIQGKGKLSMEEVQQLNDALAPGVYDAINKRLGVTKQQMANLGNEGIDSRKAIAALTAEWTSGRLKAAASNNLHTLGGQWSLLTGNAQKAMGALTLGLTHSLEKDVLPAANKAIGAITDIFGNDGLTNEQKLRRARAVIVRELGPFAHELEDKIDQADIPGHLGDLIGAAIPKMGEAAAAGAPHVASAFVNAWLHSGPWAQLLSALYIGSKVSGKLGRRGGGGLLGTAGSVLGMTKPVPVLVTNPGFGAPGKGIPGGSRGAKFGSKALNLGKKVLPFAATRALPVAGAVIGAAEAFNALDKSQTPKEALADQRRASRAAGGPTRRVEVDAKGFPLPIGSHPRGGDNGGHDGNRVSHPHNNGNLFVTVESKLDNKVIARGTAKVNAKTKARRARTG